MKRTLTIVGSCSVLFLLAVVGSVNFIALSRDATPAPSLATLIELPNGESQPLGQVIEAYAAGEVPGRAERDTASPPEPTEALEIPEGIKKLQARGMTDEEAQELTRVLADHEWSLQQPRGDSLFALADWHRHQGRSDQALALYQSIPPSDSKYSRAQRRIGWDVLTKGQSNPARGVPFVHESLAENPLDGNAWQDAARVYLATVGIPVD